MSKLRQKRNEGVIYSNIINYSHDYVDNFFQEDSCFHEIQNDFSRLSIEDFVDKLMFMKYEKLCILS